MDTDQELFASALSDDQQAAPETTVEQEKSVEPVRDERGRFAPRQPEAETQNEPAAEITAQNQQRPSEQPDHRVPLVELLNEREKRQAFEREVAEERRQREALLRHIAEMQRANQPDLEAPDIFENPQGFVESVEERIERRLREQEANFSLRLAHRQYAQEFETAYENLIKAGHSGDRQAVQSIISASDPGEALIRWHRQRQLMEKTGGDLDGFLKRREEELLSDPEFMKRVAERLRTGNVQSENRPAPVVKLPPSLSRVASAAPQAGEDDMSDAGLLRSALR